MRARSDHKKHTWNVLDMTSHKPASEGVSIEIVDLGHAEYEEILRLQYSLQKRRRQGKVRDTVLIVEHPPTITFGVREGINSLLTDRSALEQRGITFVQTDRGGGATAHNPGQVVCYPILDLQRRSMQVDEYVHALEDIGMDLLERLGVNAERREGFPGLWVKTSGGAGTMKKIASIGIHLSGMVTSHGVAININNDLEIFSHIIPCGIKGVALTSVKQLTSKEHDMEKVKKLLQECVKDRLS